MTTLFSEKPEWGQFDPAVITPMPAVPATPSIIKRPHSSPKSLKTSKPTLDVATTPAATLPKPVTKKMDDNKKKFLVPALIIGGTLLAVIVVAIVIAIIQSRLKHKRDNARTQDVFTVVKRGNGDTVIPTPAKPGRPTSDDTPSVTPSPRVREITEEPAVTEPQNEEQEPPSNINVLEVARRLRISEEPDSTKKKPFRPEQGAGKKPKPVGEKRDVSDAMQTAAYLNEQSREASTIGVLQQTHVESETEEEPTPEEEVDDSPPLEESDEHVEEQDDEEEEDEEEPVF